MTGRTLALLSLFSLASPSFAHGVGLNEPFESTGVVCRSVNALETFILALEEGDEQHGLDAANALAVQHDSVKPCISGTWQLSIIHVGHCILNNTACELTVKTWPRKRSTVSGPTIVAPLDTSC